jgi:hypothetical protein
LQDIANPEVAKHLQRYPEITDGPVLEVWQADRWREFDKHDLNPQYQQGLIHYYVDEVAELDTGKSAIPLFRVL